jgi:hypothetical protein
VAKQKAKRNRCGELSGKLNAKGEPCGAYVRKGKKTCIGHASKVEQETAGFGGSQPNAGRPRLPTPTEVARKLVEDNIAAILRPHFRVLGYDIETGAEGLVLVPLEGGGAKLHGESRDGVVRASEFDDLAAQMTAADKLLDRIYGKAKQATELSGPDGGAIPVGGEVPTDADYHANVAAILAEAGAFNPN